MDVFWPPIWSALGNKNSRPCGRLFLKYVRRRPTLPPRHQGSTIGAERLSFRVRNGTGRFPLAMTTETLWSYQSFWLNSPMESEPVSDRNSGTAQWTRA